jgi:hemerythrin-like metal-binding protein
LIIETRKHFSSEERKMRAARYPSYDWHKQQHNAVRKRIKLYGPRIEAGDLEAAKALLEFFTGWLKDHTALTDRMMGAYLRNHERETAGAEKGVAHA